MYYNDEGTVVKTLAQQLEDLPTEKLELVMFVLTDREMYECLSSQERVDFAGLALRVSMEITARRERKKE